uniref:Ig-like domain-containing protein n=1 Tax=Vombatus ursinus TaxID=29139 RepID=A0A4X2KP34_VOMUR
MEHTIPVLAGGKAEPTKDPFLLFSTPPASLSKSVVTLYPPWLHVLKDDLVSLRCEGSGTPEDKSTLWLHNDTTIPVLIQDYNITANNISYSGKYQCQRGQSALSEPVRLEVFPDPSSSTSSSSKIWYYIPFYLVMGILFTVDTGLYFTLKREINSRKIRRRPLTRWR